MKSKVYYSEKESKFPGPIIQVMLLRTNLPDVFLYPDAVSWLFNGGELKYPMQVPGGSQVNVGNLVKTVQSTT